MLRGMIFSRGFIGGTRGKVIQKHFGIDDARRGIHLGSEMRQEQIQNVTVDVNDGVRTIMLNRPEKKNALTRDMFRSLYKGLHEANEDSRTVVVAITGAGDYFTSGMDLTPGSNSTSSSSGSEEEAPTKKWKPGEMIAKFISCFLECKKPLIALVNGPAVGVGVTMLGLCDNVYASDRASFQTRFTQYGVPPEVGSTYLLPRIMGYTKASDLLIFNQKLNAEDALRAGLVSRVIPHDEFRDTTSSLLKTYGSLPVKSLMYTKELIRGRNKQLIYDISASEQKHFDPVVARSVIKEFMARKQNKSD